MPFISPQGVLLSPALEHEKRRGEEFQSSDENADSNIKVKRNYTTTNDRRPKAGSPRKTGSERVSMGPRSDVSCAKLGGICQPHRYICQGRYLKDKCSGAKTRQCCMPGIATQLNMNANTYKVRSIQHMEHLFQSYKQTAVQAYHIGIKRLVYLSFLSESLKYCGCEAVSMSVTSLI